MSGCCHSSVILIAFICHYYSVLIDDVCLQADSLIFNLIEFEPMVFSPDKNCNLSAVFSGVFMETIASFDYLMLFVSGFEQAS